MIGFKPSRFATIHKMFQKFRDEIQKKKNKALKEFICKLFWKIEIRTGYIKKPRLTRKREREKFYFSSCTQLKNNLDKHKKLQVIHRAKVRKYQRSFKVIKIKMLPDESNCQLSLPTNKK